jgi:hypothetical protein
VIQEIRRLVRAPEIVARALTAVRQDMPAIAERDVVAALDQFHDLWSALFPAEQARIVRLLVERVTVTGDGFALDLRAGGLAAVVHDMLAHAQRQGDVA